MPTPPALVNRPSFRELPQWVQDRITNVLEEGRAQEAERAAKRKNTLSPRDYSRVVTHTQRYGSPDGFTAMLHSQGGCCAICRKKISYDLRNLNTDHCHITGKARGILCNKCNSGVVAVIDRGGNSSTPYRDAAVAYIAMWKHIHQLPEGAKQ
jgi:hypothetical protein